MGQVTEQPAESVGAVGFEVGRSRAPRRPYRQGGGSPAGGGARGDAASTGGPRGSGRRGAGNGIVPGRGEHRPPAPLPRARWAASGRRPHPRRGVDGGPRAHVAGARRPSRRRPARAPGRRLAARLRPAGRGVRGPLPGGARVVAARFVRDRARAQLALPRGGRDREGRGRDDGRGPRRRARGSPGGPRGRRRHGRASRPCGPRRVRTARRASRRRAVRAVHGRMPDVEPVRTLAPAPPRPFARSARIGSVRSGPSASTDWWSGGSARAGLPRRAMRSMRGVRSS